jgi:hypothetical protein
MLRKNNRRNYMRTEAPKKTRKKLCEKRCSEKKTLKKKHMRTGASAKKNPEKTI